jgi:hypothetical protein
VTGIAVFARRACGGGTGARQRVSVALQLIAARAMLLPDSVLAAIIAGTATLSASLLQLRSALLRHGSGRGPSAALRRPKRLQFLILGVVVGAAALSGFALSQWLTNGERAAQAVMQRELQARVAEISRTASELERTRGSERAEIESGVLRRLGAEGVIVMATVAGCRASTVPTGATSGSTGAASSSPASASAAAGIAAVTPVAAVSTGCAETEASRVTVCATIPGNATVTEVALFSRAADSNATWSASRLLPGQESGQARFAAEYSESAPEAGVRQVCQGFSQWSDRSRVVRVIVHYSLQA